MGHFYQAKCKSCEYQSKTLRHGVGMRLDTGATEIILDSKKRSLISKTIYSEPTEFDTEVLGISNPPKPTKLDPERFKIYGSDPQLGPFDSRGKYIKKHDESDLDDARFFYLCPKCEKMALQFESAGLWD